MSCKDAVLFAGHLEVYHSLPNYNAEIMKLRRSPRPEMRELALLASHPCKALQSCCFSWNDSIDSLSSFSLFLGNFECRGWQVNLAEQDDRKCQWGLRVECSSWEHVAWPQLRKETALQVASYEFTTLTCVPGVFNYKAATSFGETHAPHAQNIPVSWNQIVGREFLPTVNCQDDLSGQSLSLANVGSEMLWVMLTNT